MPTPNFQWTCTLGPDPKLAAFVKSVPEKRALNALSELGIITARGLLARIEASRAIKDGPIWNAEIVGIGDAMALRFEQGATALLEDPSAAKEPTVDQVVEAIDEFWTTASKVLNATPIYHHSTRLVNRNVISIWFFALNKGSVRRLQRHDPRIQSLPPMTKESYDR